MNPAGGGLGLAVSLWRSEGPRAVVDRILDRLAEARRRRSFRRLRLPSDGAPVEAPLRSPVLNVSSTPPAPRLGGVEAQLEARRRAEAAHRPVALLYPWGRGYRLELESGEERRVAWLPGPPPAPAPALVDRALESTVARACELVDATAVHVENPHGLPLRSLVKLVENGLRLVLSMHDLSLFCLRPQLMEQPAERFCGYCRDLERCGRCLRHRWSVGDDYQVEHRRAGEAVLAAAAAVVFPSHFLRHRIDELFPGRVGAEFRVIHPAIESVVAETRPDRGALRRIGFVGGGMAHKGAAVFEELARDLATAGPSLQWTVYGGGERARLRRLRRIRGVAVRGYYRAGTLPVRLADDRIQLVLLLSVWPETFSLVLSECRLARVPVVAFDSGALGERTAGGGGLVLPPGAGAGGVATVIREIVAGTRPFPEPLPPVAETSPPEAAARHLALYGDLGLGFI